MPLLTSVNGLAKVLSLNKYKKIIGVIITLLLLLKLNTVAAEEKVSIEPLQARLTQVENTIIGYFMEDGALTDRKLASYYYRKFIKKEGNDHYLVQDFYKATDRKSSDPYTLTDVRELDSWQVKTIEGLFVRWHENGQKREQMTFRQGQLQGHFNAWYDDGYKFIECFYKDNKRHGLVTQWHKDGSKQVEVTFVEGIKQGSYLEWENNQLVRSGSYRDNHKQGVWIWYGNGIKIQQGQYIADKKSGVWIRWGTNGKKLLEEYYKDGLSEGLFKYWDSQGNLIRRAFYQDGLLRWSADSFSLNGL